MKEYIKKLIQRKGLRLSLLLIIGIVCLNAILVIYNRNVIDKNSDLAQDIQQVKDGLKANETNIHLADMGVRAYIIKQTDALLDPYNTAKNNYSQNLDSLKYRLGKLGYDVNSMAIAISSITEYMQTCQLMVDLCNQGKINEAIEIFEEDRGFDAWVRYAPFINDSNTFIDELSSISQANYNRSISFILVAQILLIILVVPILIIVYRKTLKDDRFRFMVFKRMDESNRTYLFDQGEKSEEQNEDYIIEHLETNLKKAANFINNISRGKFDIEWEGMDKNIDALNKKNIAGELIQMREQMLIGKKTDEIRIWTNEGLSNFAELVRKHQNNLALLSEELISNIVIYLNAHQGGLFFLNEDDEKKKYLELMGCYAYQRKKFLDKRIELGQGMVGQCFLEGETTYITNIPDEYVNITSGLGNTNPTTLLIVPLKINEEVVGVVEIASLKAFEKHQIEFLERIAEIIASAISTVKRNENNKILLEQSQQQSEEMRAQEEEMRQNMEELQATQEQIHRKNDEVEKLLEQASANEESMQIQLEESKGQAEEMRAQEEEMRQNLEELQATQEQMQQKSKEVENLLAQASENEESMKIQMEELEEIQKEATISNEKSKQEAEDFKNMMMEILNEVPQKIFLKDAEGKMYLANQKVADAHGIPLSELIGKSDYDFVDKKTADSWRKQELEIMKKGEEKYVFEDTLGGKKTILESFKKVFKILPLNQDGLLGIQNNITEKVELEAKLKKLEGK